MIFTLLESVIYLTDMSERTVNLRDQFGHLTQAEALLLWKASTINILRSLMTSETDVVTLHLYKEEGRFRVEVGRSDTDEPPTMQVMEWNAEEV